MTSCSLIEIPYREDTTFYIDRLLDLPNCIFFDSGVSSVNPGGRQGRFDIFSAAPLYTASLSENGLVRTESNGNSSKQVIFGKALLDYLNGMLEAHIQPNFASEVDLPFYGGFAGYFGYDLYRYRDSPSALPAKTSKPKPGTADLLLGFYPWSGVVDHQAKRAWLSFLPECPAGLGSSIQERLAAAESPGTNTIKFKLINKLYCEFNVDFYQKSLARIQDYILAGDCYQVNFARQFNGRYEGSPWCAYRQLRQSISSPFGGYFDTKIGENGSKSAILSFSPERFIELKGRHVLTQPIKGTSPRSIDPQTDRANARMLETSEKNRAENLMIVDLLRNDLGKCCEYGSIKTEKLFELQSFSNVHHLVSTVTGTLEKRLTAIDLLYAAIPGGSITGAPKIRASQVIDELEPFSRSIYCGNLGYININGNMDSNILIRSLLCDEGNIYCWGGGGIVADSDWQQEYQESIDKVGMLLRGLERIGC